jgi:putative ABC transport system permease protein
MTMLDDRPVDDLDRPSPWSNVAMSSAAEVGRWRLAARLARREIRRRPWRTLLVVLLIGVPVAGLVVGDAAYRSGQLPADTSHRFGTAAGRVVVSDSGRGDPQAELADVLAQMPSGTTSLSGAEVSFLPLRDAAHPEAVVNVDVSTIDMTADMAAGIARPTDGRLPSAPDEVFLTRRIAEAFGVGVGDTLSLVRPAQSFVVVGIGQADGYYGLFAAPGFDTTVLRPGITQWVALIDGPSVRSGSFEPSVQMSESSDRFVGTEYPPTSQTDYLALFLGWVFCILLMAVLGIVVSAAFAVSGRRQLVTIGQLSASGTDPAVLRRYLALQGTWSAGVGVVAGVVLGLGLVPLLDSAIANDGRVAVGAVDLVAIGLTALFAGTVAAIVPTRDLANTSVLAALGGRRPVGKVRPRQVRIGALAVAVGLTMMWLAVTSARHQNDTGDGLGASVVLAAGGGLAVLAGMCCVCPMVVDLIARLGSRRRGSVRLATRSLGRHRARSAALMAAVAAIGAAAMAAGATAEQDLAERHLYSNQRGLDTLEISSQQGGADETQPYEVRQVEQSTLDQIEAIVGPAEWTQTRQLAVDPDAPSSSGDISVPLVVAGPDVLDIIGLTAGQRTALAQADAAMISPIADGVAMSSSNDLGFGSLETVDIQIDSGDMRWWQVVNPEAVDRLQLQTVPASTYGRLSHDITRSEYDQLMNLNVFTNESAYFSAVRSDPVSTSIGVPFPENDYTTMTRLIILGGMLLLTTVVVGIGMALWAAEGKDERDALVSIGAPPSTMAKVVGTKAWLLATAGGVIAVPLGFGTLRLAVAAAGEQTRFPWLIAGGVVVVVPLLIGVVSTLGSAAAQRVRPVRMSTLASD